MFEGKVALVTGGSSGIGEATAWYLARNGAKVAINSRNADEIQSDVDDIVAAGFDAMPAVADISDYAAMEQAVESVVGAWGKLDLLFANAGVNGVWAPMEELDVDEWLQTVNINLNGTFYTIKTAYPHLKANGGSIVVTASVNGTRMFSNTGATAYSATKAAQAAMVKMLAVEFAPHKVRINVVCPGTIDTDIEENTDRQDIDSAGLPVEFPKGKIPLTGKQAGTSAQVAQLVGFLLSDNASHITGTEVFIDGAQSLLQG